MSNEIQLRAANPEDAPVLAEMNIQFIEAEGSPNDMSLEQLTERMQGWLSGDREAVVVEYKDEIIGYLIYWRVADEFYPYKDSIYIRQFFILPSYRRRGIGQIAFDRIVSEVFGDDTALTLDVLHSNPEAKAFWEKMGFEVYHTTMRRE